MSAGEDGIEKVEVDMLKVRQRKRDIVDQFRAGSTRRLKDAGVEVIMGEARFKDGKTLNVTMNNLFPDITISADLIFINTGERPASPKIRGIENVDPAYILDSTSIQEIDNVPKDLVVVGGGYVGLEFAQLFRRLGANVSIIQRGRQLLPREDLDIAECMLKILEEDGIKIYLHSDISTIRSESHPINVSILSHDDASVDEVRGTHLLVAAGRVPNTTTLNLPVAGIATTEKGYIVVNERLETTSPGVYAMGDVKGPPAFTHISYDDFRIIRANLIDKPDDGSNTDTQKTQKQQKSPSTTTNRLVPYVVYTDPQLGHIGLHEHEARRLFPDRKIQVAKMPMSYVARALETDESRGMMKAVVDGETGEILGFTCLGMEGGEVMAVVQTAMKGGLGWEVLRDMVWAHPSLAEGLNNLWGFLE